MKKTQLAAKLTYCDRVGARYMLPFGRIRPRKETYWVFQMSGWEGEAYDVVAVRSEDVRYVLGVFAGGVSRWREQPVAVATTSNATTPWNTPWWVAETLICVLAVLSRSGDSG